MSTESTEMNKAVIRRYFEEVHNRQNSAVIEEIIALPLVEPTRRVVEMHRTAFPDYQITMRAQVAEDDMVATVWTLEGTHEGEWLSPIGPITPTGKRVSYTGTTTVRITDGKTVEIIGSNHDHLGLLQQMDVLPATAPRSGA